MITFSMLARIRLATAATSAARRASPPPSGRRPAGGRKDRGGRSRHEASGDPGRVRRGLPAGGGAGALRLVGGRQLRRAVLLPALLLRPLLGRPGLPRLRRPPARRGGA